VEEWEEEREEREEPERERQERRQARGRLPPSLLRVTNSSFCLKVSA
jgi:hypothetical protein